MPDFLKSLLLLHVSLLLLTSNVEAHRPYHETIGPFRFADGSAGEIRRFFTDGIMANDPSRWEVVRTDGAVVWSSESFVDDVAFHRVSDSEYWIHEFDFTVWPRRTVHLTQAGPAPVDTGLKLTPLWRRFNSHWPAYLLTSGFFSLGYALPQFAFGKNPPGEKAGPEGCLSLPPAAFILLLALLSPFYSGLTPLFLFPLTVFFCWIWRKIYLFYRSRRASSLSHKAPPASLE